MPPLHLVVTWDSGISFRAIGQALDFAQETSSEVDKLLEVSARSEVIDPDPEGDHSSSERLAYLKELKVLYPGDWQPKREPRKKKKGS